MSPEIARRVVALCRKFPPPRRGDDQLTPHEMRLLEMLAAGHNWRTAAAELDVSVNTSAFHIKSIYARCRCTRSPRPWPGPCATE